MSSANPDLLSAIRDWLEPRHEVPRGASWERLPGGRVNHLWRVRGQGRDRVVKLYCRNGESPLFPNDPRAELAVMQALAGKQLAPESGRLFTTPVGQCLMYGHVAGELWSEGAAAVAKLLANVHDAPPPAALRQAPVGAEALLAQGVAILAGCSGPRRKLLASLMPEAREGPAGRLTLIHGDPVAGNMVASPDGLRLIDWQCPAIGDPAEDLAIFLSPAMQSLYLGRRLSAVEEAEFLAAYPDDRVVARLHHLRAIFHWRMAAHCLWRATRGDADYADALELELDALRECHRSRCRSPEASRPRPSTSADPGGVRAGG